MYMASVQQITGLQEATCEGCGRVVPISRVRRTNEPVKVGRGFLMRLWCVACFYDGVPE